MLLLWAISCATVSATGTPGDTQAEAEPEPTPEGALALEGAVVLGRADEAGPLYIVDGQIVSEAPAGAAVVDVSGTFIVPAFIDSHVHFAYQPDTDEMLDGGVVAGVDLAAPIDSLSSDLSPMRVLWAGPMVTAEGGYPTQSWGRNGYGIECGDASAAEAAVDLLADAGAAVIKVPISSGPVFDDAALEAVVSRASGRGLPVVVHALSDAQAARGAAAGATVLAHTPTEALSAETVSAWAGGAVISTLAAFGGSDAEANLAALRAEGATVLYGTDFGNLRTPGISSTEIARLSSAGLSASEILAAGTSAPASFWGLETLGHLGAGAEASFLVLRTDPREEPGALSSPEQVWVQGARR